MAARGGLVQRLEFDPPDGKIACWASGLDEKRRRPLLLVMGGIVSVKEQWAPLLPKLRRMGFAAVVTELPGVGENTCAYHPESWRLLPHLLDRLSGSAGTDDASLLALSFSGHLALRAATEDHRIRRVPPSAHPSPSSSPTRSGGRASRASPSTRCVR